MKTSILHRNGLYHTFVLGFYRIMHHPLEFQFINLLRIVMRKKSSLNGHLLLHLFILNLYLSQSPWPFMTLIYQIKCQRPVLPSCFGFYPLLLSQRTVSSGIFLLYSFHSSLSLSSFWTIIIR